MIDQKDMLRDYKRLVDTQMNFIRRLRQQVDALLGVNANLLELITDPEVRARIKASVEETIKELSIPLSG